MENYLFYSVTFTHFNEPSLELVIKNFETDVTEDEIVKSLTNVNTILDPKWLSWEADLVNTHLGVLSAMRVDCNNKFLASMDKQLNKLATKAFKPHIRVQASTWKMLERNSTSPNALIKNISPLTLKLNGKVTRFWTH